MVMIVSVTPARNEEKHIRWTLQMARGQVDRMILVDDGSTDNTALIARAEGARVVPAPKHPTLERTLRICDTINRGLREVPRETEYVLVLGGDCVLQSNYVDMLLSKMDEDPGLVITSGHVKGAPYNPTQPHGTRIVRWKWWRDANGGQYDLRPGWESMLFIRAEADGKRYHRFKPPLTISQRPLGTNTEWVSRGKAMRLNGYTWIGLVNRALHLARRGRWSSARDMVAAYLASTPRAEPWVTKTRKKMLRRAIRRKLNGWPGM